MSGFRKEAILLFRSRELYSSAIPGVGTLVALLALVSKSPHLSTSVIAIPYLLFTITTGHTVTIKFWRVELPMFTIWRWTSLPPRLVYGALLVVFTYVYISISAVFVSVCALWPQLWRLLPIGQVLPLGLAAVAMGIASGTLSFGWGIRRGSGDQPFVLSRGNPLYQGPLLVAIVLNTVISIIGIAFSASMLVTVFNVMVGAVAMWLARGVVVRKLGSPA